MTGAPNTRLAARLPRATHPALLSVTIVLIGLGVAAVRVVRETHWYLDCDSGGIQRDGMDCFGSIPSTHDAFPGSIGFTPLMAIVALAALWCLAYLWLVIGQHRERMAGGTKRPARDG